MALETKLLHVGRIRSFWCNFLSNKMSYPHGLWQVEVWDCVFSGPPCYAGPTNKYFLQQHRSYGLMLNIDWFQPYKDRKNSIGIVYMANLNLPRSIRHKRDNVIVVSIIPDFDHEPKDISSYIDPIVDQMTKLWNPGVMVNTHTQPEGTKIKAALVCTSADSPATRKLSGFLGHSAIYGCTKCKHRFNGKVGEKDYSGFDKSLWPKRTYAAHTSAVRQQKAAKNVTARKRLESELGYR